MQKLNQLMMKNLEKDLNLNIKQGLIIGNLVSLQKMNGEN